MPRTTINIEPSVLDDLKRRARLEKRTLSELASELLAAALSDQTARGAQPFVWIAKPLNAKVDLGDWSVVKRQLDDEDMEGYE
jgi:hypothetical protein